MSRLLVGVSVGWLGLSFIGDVFPSLVLPAYLTRDVEPDSLATVLGVLTFVALLAGALIQPVAGAISDRLSPRTRRRVAVGVGALVLGTGLIAMAAVGGVVGVGLAFVVVVVGANIAQSGQQGFIPDLVPARLRGRASGLKGLADVGGAFVGFLILGLLIAAGEFTAALVVTGAVIAVCTLVTVFAVDERVATATVQSAAPVEMDRSVFWRAVAARFLFLLATFAIGRFLLLFAAARLGIPVAEAAGSVGSLFALLTVTTAVASVPAGLLADRFGRERTMVAGAVISAIGAGLLATAASLPLMLAFGGLMAIGSAGFASANWALAADLVAGPSAGRLMGIANFGTAGAAAIAGLFGPLVDTFGYAAVFVPAVALFIGAALVSWRDHGAVIAPPPRTIARNTEA